MPKETASPGASSVRSRVDRLDRERERALSSNLIQCVAAAPPRCRETTSTTCGRLWVRRR